MCAGGRATIRDKECGIYMGYYGGSLRVGKVTYKQGKTTPEEKEKFVKYLKRFTKDELINMMLDLVENSDE